jgi:Leucine-rich repeat (LRR) protein
MRICYVYYSVIFCLISYVYNCPIPFHIQSKCRCAITENGRVYIYCARKQLTVIPHFNNSMSREYNRQQMNSFDASSSSSSGNIIFDELVLSGNRISIVHENAFTGLKLRKLELQSNPIHTIEHQAFIDLANYLEEFTLSTTVSTSQLTSQTLMQILMELPNLKRLALRSFNLTVFDNHSMSSTNFILRKLTQLSLQSCSIAQVNSMSSLLRVLPNLERLDLSENRFEHFDVSLVSTLNKLKILNLSKNKIRHVNIHPSLSLATYNPSSSLIELDLSYNGR